MPTETEQIKRTIVMTFEASPVQLGAAAAALFEQTIFGECIAIEAAEPSTEEALDIALGMEDFR